MNTHWPAPDRLPSLSSTDAHVWRVPLDVVASQPNALIALLSPEERQRAEQFRIEAPRRCFVATRVALRTLLGKYLQKDPADVRCMADSNGKPRLGDNERNSDIRFNVAHSGNMALIAITLGCEIGVDVERLRPVRHCEHIAERYFHPAEIAAILAAPTGERDQAFLRCWTGKEALLKAVGTGITGSLAEFQVPSEDIGDRSVCIDVPVRSASSVVRCWLQHLAPDTGYVAALATIGENRTVQRFSFTA